MLSQTDAHKYKEYNVMTSIKCRGEWSLSGCAQLNVHIKLSEDFISALFSQ